MTMLERVKIANRLTTAAYDEELEELIEEAKADLQLKGILMADGTDPAEDPADSDPNIRKAIVLYCSIHHGQREDREMLQKAYDDLKARLGMSTGYTTWAAADAGDGGEG